MNIEVIIGDNIRKIRENKLNVSQEDLAFQADLHRAYIGRIERAEASITVRNLQKIAKALGVEPYILLMKDAYKTISGKK